jgi:hydrogenase maturation factor
VLERKERQLILFENEKVADASGRGFVVDESACPGSREARVLADYFGVSVLELISSGALLIAVDPKHVDNLLETFQRNNVVAAKIGVVTQDASQRQVKSAAGDTRLLNRPEQDALWTCLAKQ